MLEHWALLRIVFICCGLYIQPQRRHPLRRGLCLDLAGELCAFRLGVGPGLCARLLMARFASLLVLCAPAACAAVGDILLASFDGKANHSWKQMNDPVMGGKSTGSFAVENQLGIFDGEVVDVPFLKAPGFIKASVVDMNLFGHIFPDISACKSITLEVKSDTDYKGYRFSIGNAHAPGGKFFAYGYKSNFDAGKVGEWTSVTLPLSGFTDYWDDATGEAIKTCQENKIYCPDEKTLKDMRTMGFWAEGVAGKVHLEIKSVTATDCNAMVV